MTVVKLTPTHIVPHVGEDSPIDTLRRFQTITPWRLDLRRRLDVNHVYYVAVAGTGQRVQEALEAPLRLALGVAKQAVLHRTVLGDGDEAVQRVVLEVLLGETRRGCESA